jgi:Type II secretion system (T2SS), protein E, N-terminal domain
MSALALESEPSKLEFGSGLRARVQLVRTGDLLLTLPELRPRPELLGELLVEAGLVTPAELERALEDAKERRRRLGEVLLEQKHLSPDDLVRLLGEQRGMPFLDLARFDVDPAAARLMPAATARLFKTLPVGFASGRPVVAVGDPTDELAIARALSFVREARFVASSDAEILARLESIGL